MKKLGDFYTEYLNEGRRPGSKNKPKEWPEDPKKIAEDPEVKDATPAKDVNLKDVETVPGPKVQVGKEPTASTKYDVDSPDPDWAEQLAKLDIDALDDNSYELSERFDDGHDFLVLGEAGWAKTSVIKAMAKKHGYHVLTVYLDKAVATDLGGIPIPAEDEKTKKTHMDYAVPEWALYMMQHPKDKFLLFFDEMNQAAPDVLNALMPIVLEHVICSVKFDNFIVGAAGNLANENESLSELNKPLRDRFKPIINWETHTDDSWKSAFAFLHQTFDKTLGEEIVNKLEEMKEFWNSPRDLDRVLLSFVQANNGRDARKYSRPTSIKNKLEAITWDEADTSSRAYEKNMNELADYISQYIKGGSDSAKGEDEESSRRASKGSDNINKDDKEALMDALEKGNFYFSSANGGDNEHYVCTLENCITSLFDPEVTGITAEVLRHIVKDMDAAGRTIKFKTDDDAKEEAKKHGWKWA